MNTPLPFQALSDDVCASPQLNTNDLRQVAQAGFQSVINNRPDFEGGPDQPTSAAIEAAARAAGLHYAYVPVIPGQHTADDVMRMGHLLATLPKPILLFCRSGARSSRLYQLATQG